MGNKRTSSKGNIVNIVIPSIVIVIVFLLIGTAATLLSKKTSNQITEALDNVDRNMAIKQLSELRGMILEVESLKKEDISQNILLNELEEITAQKHFTNPYLKDFVFTIPSTSTVGELCEELVSQIDEQIHTIEFDTKGE